MKRVVLLGGVAVLLWGMIPLVNAAREKSTEVEEEYLTKVETLVFCRGVEDHVPVDEADEFDLSTERVYCFTKIVTEEAPTSITHVWYVDGNKVSEVPLDISYPAHRTWSYKTVWAGNWTVEVVSERGEVLQTAEVVVKEYTEEDE